MQAWIPASSSAGAYVKIRREKGWPQEKLAFESDVHRTYISGVERGARNPTVLVLGRIADALGVSLAALFGGR